MIDITQLQTGALLLIVLRGVKVATHLMVEDVAGINGHHNLSRVIMNAHILVFFFFQSE